MNRIGEYISQRELKADSEGNLLVSCPQCKEDFKTPVKNINPGNMALKEKINCPLCGIELDQVYPDKGTKKKMLEEIGKKARKDIAKTFSKEFRVNLKL